MSIMSEDAVIKPEVKSEGTDSSMLEDIPMDEAIDIENAVVIMPDGGDGALGMEGSVVVVASVSSSGELVTSDGEPVTEPLDGEPSSSIAKVEEPKDPNTCKYCDKVFRSQTGMKRHLIVCQPEPEEEDVDDPLAFEICHCCGEPIDTAHKVFS